MSEPEWETPAPDRRNEPFRAALRSRPGEWAVYRDARYTVYARYVGGES